MILSELGIFGWKEADENLVLSSLLTGDPLLLIGNHGCAKTHVANKVAQALGRRFLVYDASKAMFEDILGFPNIQKLQQGEVEYVPSPVTVWDKEMILIDELNRSLQETANRWLEIIRSRKIMGFPTQVKWVWAAMNPLSYSGTQALDAAMIGRFAIFLYPPDVLQMDEADRIKVAIHINGDDAPSLSEWTGGECAATVAQEDVEGVGSRLRETLTKAGGHFLRLRSQMPTLAEFLAKFADLLVRETKGEVALDGRRLGFIHRNLLANRAVELAKTEVFGAELPDFVESARYVVQSSIPIGLNDEGLKREEAVHKMEICFDLLSSYFQQGAELARVNLIYELFTTPDLMRRAELLLTRDLGEMALSKAWTDLMKEDRDITLLAYTALQVEARRQGTVPQELLASLAGKVSGENLSTKCIGRLEGDAVEYIDEVEALLKQDSDLGCLVAYQHVRSLIESRRVNPQGLTETEHAIREDLRTFERLLDGDTAQRKGGVAA
ncbi:MAG TPA: MoxR family ATPase [Candidatus Hydrogenedentes bacterium]|nr:MoxR family ATPase [Candidatus Hydrogenedentota bacterium]